jgi:hypothetical protein
MHESWKSTNTEAGYRMDLANREIIVEVWDNLFHNVVLTEEQLRFLADAYRRFKLVRDGRL